MKGNQPGSFVTAEKIAQIQEQKKAAVATGTPPPTPPTPEAPPAPAAAAPADAEAEARAKRIEEFKKSKKANEDVLEVKITDEDIQNYIFRGRVLKDKIVAIKGKVEVTFQTMTPKELDAVDQYVAELRGSDEKHTMDGIANLRTVRQLAYAWVKINGKALPPTVDARAKAIAEMGSHLVNRVVSAYQAFDLLVELTLREEEFLKK